MSEVHVGVDVSKLTLDVFVSQHGCVEQFDNTHDGLDALVSFLRPFEPTLVLCEASGGYEKLMIRALLAAEIPVARANAARVRYFAESMGQLAKTDGIDAQIIARYAEVSDITPLVPSSTVRQALREHVRHRRQLVEMKTALRQTRSHYEFESTDDSAIRLLEQIESEIAAMDAALEELLEEDEQLAEQAEIITSINGVGVKTAANLLSELPELGKVSSKEIAALAGLAPFARESGQKHGQRYCRGGRKEARTGLYMAAVSARRSNPAIRAFFERLVERGKPGKVALVACMRKLLVWINAMLRDGVRFDPEQAQGLVPAT